MLSHNNSKISIKILDLKTRVKKSISVVSRNPFIETWNKEDQNAPASTTAPKERKKKKKTNIA
jgi:hypothetical protein